MDRIPAEEWTAVAPELSLPELNNLDRDGVSIQCWDSCDFVVGRQTNFNGPVVIINCTDVLEQTSRGACEELTNGKLVINEKVLSQSATTKMQRLAMEKEKPSKGKDKCHKKLKIPAWVCLGILAVFGIGLSVFYATAPTEERPTLACTAISKQTCLYSKFPWGGRPPHDSKPLTTPVSYVIILQTHSDFCYDIAECLRVTEIFHLNGTERSDCNFLLGGEGNIYEDLGWSRDNSPGGPKALRICFMGDFIDDFPTHPQVVAAKALISFGVDRNFIKNDFVLVASNATSPDDSLTTIYSIIKNWHNFVENPFPKEEKRDKSVI